MGRSAILSHIMMALRAAICGAMTLVPVSAAAEGRVTVFAAASLQGVMAELAGTYPGGASVSVGGSGMIARQIASGAPADAVILANPGWMDWLEGERMVDPRRRIDLLGNRLVLIAPADTPDLADLTAVGLLARLEGGRLAIGQTAGVPAGIYGRQWLEAAGLWEALMPHLAETDNVRAALALVARGEAPLGLVYATDAAAEPGVRVIHEVPDGMHGPIVYPAAALSEAGAKFLTFVQDSEASAVFVAHGFALRAAAP